MCANVGVNGVPPACTVSPGPAAPHCIGALFMHVSLEVPGQAVRPCADEARCAGVASAARSPPSLRSCRCDTRTSLDALLLLAEALASHAQLQSTAAPVGCAVPPVLAQSSTAHA